MTPEIAKIIFRDIPEDTLQTYVEDRIKNLQQALEVATSWDQVLRIQGQIAEVKYLAKTREYAENILKQLKR